MYTVQPQTVVTLVLLGDVSPRKYLYICWDFKMSQTESSSNPMKKKGHSQFELGSVHSTSWDPHCCIPICKRALETSTETQLNSAFLISTKKESFRLYVRDPSPNWPCRWRCEFSPGSSLSWIPAWEQPLWLCLSPSNILLPGQLPVETQMASVATIILWLIGPFSWTALPTVPVIQATMHSLASNITWAATSQLFPTKVRPDSNLHFRAQERYIYLKGGKRSFETQLRKTVSV